MATAAPGIDPAQVLDPSLYGEQQIIQQRQALATLLKQKGLDDLPGIQMAGRVAVGNSPVEGLARMAQILSGQNMQDQVNSQQQDYGRRQAMALQQLFGMNQQPQQQGPSAASAAMGMGATQGSVGPTPANAQLMNALNPPQQPQQSPQQSPMGVGSAPPMSNLMSYTSDPAAHMKAVIDQYAQTPEMKNAAAAYGVGTPGYMNALRDEVQKAGYVAPAEARQGNLTLDRNNNPIAYNPAVEKGVNPQFQTKNGFTSATGASVIPGYADSAATIAGAESGGKALGKAPYEVVEGYDTNSKAPTKNYAGNVLTPPNAASGAAAQRNSVYTPDSVQIMESEAAAEKDPGARARLYAEAAKARQATGMQSGPALGQSEAAVGQQKSVDQKWADLNASNSSAQTVVARLQTLKSLAPAAISGAQSERKDFYNGLLAMAGMKTANDAKTASDLVDKNAAQIVSSIRMGQGGAGTDALQTLVQSANPNRHMTLSAIQDAVDQLVSVQQMTQAKARVLQPTAVGGGRDPAAYSQREVQFDQNADPRIWQYQAITDPTQRKAFAQGVMKQDPNFAQKIQTLEKMGAL